MKEPTIGARYILHSDVGNPFKRTVAVVKEVKQGWVKYGRHNSEIGDFGDDYLDVEAFNNCYPELETSRLGQ